MPLSGPRERRMLEKENNFQQPGERFRTFDRARQDRFIERLCEFLGEPRCTQVCLAFDTWPTACLNAGALSLHW